MVAPDLARNSGYFLPGVGVRLTFLYEISTDCVITVRWLPGQGQCCFSDIRDVQ